MLCIKKEDARCVLCVFSVNSVQMTELSVCSNWSKICGGQNSFVVSSVNFEKEQYTNENFCLGCYMKCLV